MKEHHFVVCASFDAEGHPHFYITDSVCDPDEPIWDTETDTWGRAEGEDADNDFLLMTALAEALADANITKEKE